MTEEYLKSIMEPITRENITELKPGDWIWDSILVERRAHDRSLRANRIMEPYGFRQIDILDEETENSYHPFMLSTGLGGYAGLSSFEWTYFLGDKRYYKFKDCGGNTK